MLAMNGCSPPARTPAQIKECQRASNASDMSIILGKFLKVLNDCTSSGNEEDKQRFAVVYEIKSDIKDVLKTHKRLKK